MMSRSYPLEEDTILVMASCFANFEIIIEKEINNPIITKCMFVKLKWTKLIFFHILSFRENSFVKKKKNDTKRKKTKYN